MQVVIWLDVEWERVKFGCQWVGDEKVRCGLTNEIVSKRMTV